MSSTEAEAQRLADAHEGVRDWRRWGPYLSERQWGTVREDYSPNGTAWDYFTHDEARSRAYRWGEDGIAGFCDDRQLLCLSLALWNGADPILKERLFGLTNGQGNHGEDVKELYYYLDAVPSYAYARTMYKLPHGAYPYQQLIDENAHRKATAPNAPEFELIDTGLFDDDRYFDVEVEYAKDDVDAILMRITVHNRGPDAARIHVLPQAWFRNTWSWRPGIARPSMKDAGDATVAAEHAQLGAFHIRFENPDRLLFCDNDTNARRLFGMAEAAGYFKDAFHDYVIGGRTDAVNSAGEGTKVAGLYARDVPACGAIVIRVRLAPSVPEFADFDAVFSRRIAEADEFYAGLQARIADSDMRRVQRQAFAGMLWSKQFYCFDVAEWLDGDPLQPSPPEDRKEGRDSGWRHLNSAAVISMPDKWEYPWFAAWDLAFHCVTLAQIEPSVAKQQLLLLCQVWMMHPNGELPAYEWAFADVNPPVQAWAALRIYETDRQGNGGAGDTAFLERVFHKLLLNFTWWVNRKDPNGLNIFEGGFLGLDNIGVFDRSAPLPDGAVIDQSDGTAWMAMYCLNLLRMAIELAKNDIVYEDMAVKFLDHFLQIAKAMTDMGASGIGLWDDTDDFYYDVLCTVAHGKIPIRLRSMVGLIPLFAVEVFGRDEIEKLPNLAARMRYYQTERPDLAGLVSRWHEQGAGGRGLLSLARAFRMKKLLQRMLDETEFLSPHGVRALSRIYLDHPYEFDFAGVSHSVKYLPGESDGALFGGNSNWRGPVWMPVNYMVVESLRRFHEFYGDRLTVECPTGSGTWISLGEVADELCRRLAALFLRGADGRRPVSGDNAKIQSDPHFKDHILFYEYYHGDNGRGVGASHQTGWSGLIACLIDQIAARSAVTAEVQSRSAQPVG